MAGTKHGHRKREAEYAIGLDSHMGASARQNGPVSGHAPEPHRGDDAAVQKQSLVFLLLQSHLFIL